MLTFDDLKNYFEKFFVDYGPYRSNKVYSIILDTLIKNYFNNAYNEVPASFKSAYEEQKIPLEFYNNILLSVGFTVDILNKISYKDKEILLKTYTDFNIYKGTINQIQKVASDFEEDLNLYELLIDFRTVLIPYYYLVFTKDQNYVVAENSFIYDSIKVNDYIQVPNDKNSYRVVVKKENNKIYINKPFDFNFILENNLNSNDNEAFVRNVNINRWVFVPELIYSGDKVKDKILKTFLDYEKIYNNTKKYFISIEHLESKKEELLLPVKSNLILLDYKKFRDINLLNYLFSAIILKEYRKSRLVLYFKDGNYLTNLERIYKLWYYIIFRFYNKGITTNGMPNPGLIFSIDSPYFNLTVDDVSRIKEEYNNLKTTNEVSLFYNKYFSSSFNPLTNYNLNMSIDQFKLLIENEIGTDLLTYIDKRILSVKGIDSELECSFILDEIYASVMTWAFTDIKIKNVISYLLDSLSYISTSVEFSPSYNLILFLKPFHVELIKELDDVLEINSKFDMIIPHHKLKYLIKMFGLSVLTISHSFFKSQIILNSVDNVIIASDFKNSIIYKSKSLLTFFDNFKILLSYFEESVSFQNHKLLFNLKLSVYSFLHCINECVLTIINKNNEYSSILESNNLELRLDSEGILQFVNLIKGNLDLQKKMQNFATDEHSLTVINKHFDEYNIVIVSVLTDIVSTSISVNDLFEIASKSFLSLDMIDSDSSGRPVLDDIELSLSLIDSESSGRQLVDNIDLSLSLIDSDSSGRSILTEIEQRLNFDLKNSILCSHEYKLLI